MFTPGGVARPGTWHDIGVTSLKRLAPIACAGLLVLASCGSSEGDSSGAGSTTSTSEETPDGAADATTTVPQTAEPTTSTTAAGNEDQAAGEGLTATDRGVTADAIRLGLALTDVSQFANVGEVVPRFEAAVAAANDAGGVNGRSIELVIEEWSLADPAALSASCTSLTEDHELFLVLAWATNSDLTCYTDIHEHIVINSFDLPVEPDPLLFTVLGDPVTTMLGGLGLLEAELSGAKVAIQAADGYRDAIGDAKAALDGVGAEVVSETIGSPVESQSDQLAIETESDIYHERWVADGAEFVLTLGSGQATLGALERAGSDLTMIGSNNNVQAMSALGNDLGAVSLLVIAAPTVNDDAEAGLWGIPECVERIESATGQEILIRPGDADERGLVSTVRACAVVDTFVAIAEGAGADLTQESFLAAMETVGEFTMTGAESGSLGSDKHHAANSSAAVYVYDEAAADFVLR